MTPTHKTIHSAGADLSASETVTIEPGKVRLVGTGFSIHDGFYDDWSNPNMVFMLFIRSSLALKRGLMLANSVGVIDSDYREEIKAMFFNPTDEPVTIKRGERIAQLVPMQYVRGIFPYEQTERQGGFGSTGQSR